jgi:hypothetical protein
MVIKGNLIGYFLWLIILIIANLLSIEISTIVMLVGGYATILLVLIFMNHRAIKNNF